MFVSGPWKHGAWHRERGSSIGDIQFGSETSDYFKKHIVTPFFRYHLKGEGDWNPPEAIVFETGQNRWRNFDAWPPPDVEARNLYFHSGGRLSFDEPDDRMMGPDEYVSDPNKPVPFTTDI